MRRFSCVLLSAALLLSGHAWSDTPGTTPVKKAKKCLFPKSKKRAPAWVCDAHIDGLTMAAVGSAAKSKAGTAFMEGMAAADARAQLANKLHGTPQTEAVNESLQGSKVLKSTYGPNGTLYVLVGIDEPPTQQH